MKKKLSLFAQCGRIRFKIFRDLNEMYFSKIRNKNLKNKKFTIISNNCWGGWVYRTFNLQYQSPTIGLFIMPKDYLKFINNLEHYIKECKLEFIKPTESKYYNYLKMNTNEFGTYPIGLLGDIEIEFLHYKTEEEAREKWNRRAKRINWDNLIIKFNDQNGCTQEDINQFNKINKFKKMLCFTAKKIEGPYNIYMWEFSKDQYVVDDTWFCKKHVNLKKLIER